MRWRAQVTIGLALIALAGIAHWIYFHATHVLAGYAFVRAEVIQIGSPIDAQVINVRVTSGQHVKATELLVELNHTREQARVEEARAALVANENELAVAKGTLKVDRLRVAALKEQLAARVRNLEADHRTYKMRVEQADKAATRDAELSAERLVSSAQAETSQVNASMLKEQQLRAREREQLASGELRQANIEHLAIDTREERLMVFQAQVEKAKAALALAEAQLAMTALRAPKEGEISRVLVGAGASVRAGSPLLEMWIPEPISIEAWINESDLGRIKIGNAATITIDALDHLLLHGHIDSFGYVTDEEQKDLSKTTELGLRLAKAHWLRVRITLDDKHPRLLPGLSAEVAIDAD